jgi:hypothetical protein
VAGEDRQLFRFLDTDSERFADVVRQASGDADVEAYVRQRVEGRSPAEIEAWNRQFLDYEPDLSRSSYDGQREALARRAPGRSDITLWVHLTDMEEGRDVPSPEAVQAFRAGLAQPQTA